jgi:hypothetical protein
LAAQSSRVSALPIHPVLRAGRWRSRSASWFSAHHRPDILNLASIASSSLPGVAMNLTEVMAVNLRRLRHGTGQRRRSRARQRLTPIWSR